MKKINTRKAKAKAASINYGSDEWLFNDVKDNPEFKRGYQKEMIAELIETMKKTRLKKGISQQRFAKLVGTKQQVIARLEKHGADDMKLSTFLNMTNILHIDPRKLLHIFPCILLILYIYNMYVVISTGFKIYI